MKTDDMRYRFFANLTEPVRTISMFIHDVTYPIAVNSDSIIAYSCVYGLFVNFFHIFILSRKSMRQSSINLLMIGQSISDIICFFYKTSSIPVVKNFLTDNNECDTPVSYFHVLGSYSYYYLDAICRRISPWIGVVMAAFRFLIVSFPVNDAIGKLGKPLSSLCSILILFLMSSALSASFYMSQSVKNTGQWVPPESCGYPANYSLAGYGLVTKYDIDEAVSDFYFFWTAVFVNLPPIILPFITAGLIRILKKYETNRAHLSGNSKEVIPYNTTKLVVMMTVCLMVTEASYRVSDTLELYLDGIAPASAMLIILNFDQCFQIFYPLNSIAHCFINMLLSSEYRKCIKGSFTCFNSRVSEQGRSQPLTINVGARIT